MSYGNVNIFNTFIDAPPIHPLHRSTIVQVRCQRTKNKIVITLFLNKCKITY